MEKISLILLGIVLTSVFQFLTALVIKKSDKKLKHAEQLKLLTGEIEDLTRHCVANLVVLKSIDLDKGIPSDLHFEKMKIMDTSLIFSSDTYSFIDSKYTGYINRLKLEIRNINIEIESVIRYKKNNVVDKKILKDHLDYLFAKMNFTINNLPDRLSEFGVLDKKILERITAHKEDNQHKERIIIYIS